MHVREAMTRDVCMVRPDQTLREAAKMMGQIDAGVLPVTDGERLIGMITDRDIAVRGVGMGKDPQTPVREVMTEEVKYCFDDEDIDHVAENMGDIQVRRLPVLSREKRLVGILSLGDIAHVGEADCAGIAMLGISEPSRQHNQRIDGGAAR